MRQAGVASVWVDLGSAAAVAAARHRAWGAAVAAESVVMVVDGALANRELSLIEFADLTKRGADWRPFPAGSYHAPLILAALPILILPALAGPVLAALLLPAAFFFLLLLFLPFLVLLATLTGFLAGILLLAHWILLIGVGSTESQERKKKA